jgi:hypothetical protein
MLEEEHKTTNKLWQDERKGNTDKVVPFKEHFKIRSKGWHPTTQPPLTILSTKNSKCFNNSRQKVPKTLTSKK